MSRREPRPRRRSDRAIGKRLFSFVVVADTHVNQEEGKAQSPFPVNGLANARARYAFAEINRLDPAPEFVLHLGDIVHPVPELPSFPVAVQRFKELAADLRVPLHLVAGNHDMGDKPLEWLPAGSVTSEYVDLYRSHFGRDYYSFDTRGCHFVVINAQVINSGLAVEREQREWLEADLRASAHKRTFLGIHYPPYICDRYEPSNYDNIDEPGRSWLLGLIEQHRSEALFAGHVHNFWYDVHGETEIYLLPSTAFVRQDYTELYRVDAGPEYGRNDKGKLGFFIVDVHEKGHVAHFARTFGHELGPRAGAGAGVTRLERVHTKTNVRAAAGVDLRHPWTELVEVAATGGVQEFERKLVRNDYTTMSLWEMGVRRLRVPLQDLLDDRVRERMKLMREMGHEFVAYGFGLPAAHATRILAQEPWIIDAIELVLPWAEVMAAFPKLQELRSETGISLYLSKLRKHEDAKYDGSRYSHFINHGFVLAERAQLDMLLEHDRERRIVDGIVFRVARGQLPWDAAAQISEYCRTRGMKGVAHVRLAAENPAESMDDDGANANRVAEAILGAMAHDGIEIFFDTFLDVDRGYFPRNGFVDRRYNPRLASRVYAHLHSALQRAEGLRAVCAEENDGIRVLWAENGASLFALILPKSESSVSNLDLPEKVQGPWKSVRAYDLDRGTFHAMEPQLPQGGSSRLSFATPITTSAPLLLELDSRR